MMNDEVKKQLEIDKEFLKRCPLHKMDMEFGIDKDTKTGIIKVSINGDERLFHPIDLCETLFFIASENADNAKFKNDKININEQARIFLQLKSDVTQIIERFIRAMNRYPDWIKYDFSGFYRQIDAPYDRAKLNLDIKLINSQVSANKSTLATNARVVSANKILIAVFIATALFSLASAISSYLYYKLERTKYLESKTAKAEQLKIAQQDSLLHKKDQDLARQQIFIDSLKTENQANRKP